MQIILNGEPKTIDEKINLKELVFRFCKNSKYVIAEVNGDIIKNTHWAEKSVQEGDSVELVNFVGGG